ncbi:MAG: glycosyltransferase family 2 protein [Actinomycetota bacterium]
MGGLPVLPDASGRAAVRGARFALALTAVAWVGYLIELTLRLARSPLGVRPVAETLVYLVLVSLLAGSASAYLLARLGHFQRAGRHRRVPRSTIDGHFDHREPSATVLVPSYREEEHVVVLTLLTCALQEYPDLRVVLLIDDPPRPRDPDAAQALDRAREIPGEVQALLAEPSHRFEAALAAYESTIHPDGHADGTTLEVLAEYYDDAASWINTQRADLDENDHVDQFVAIEVLDRLAGDLAATAVSLREAAMDPRALMSHRRVGQLYRRLAWIFRVEMASFERKRFASLSHEANKAMNLNSYLGLMGGDYRIETSPGGDVLLPAGDGRVDVSIPAADYVVTVDADSVLLPEYCLRLVHHLELPEHQDVAVAQTPYSAYRGAPTRIERMAGATTDVQHIVHQGLTHFDATFWVGANAVIRRTALDDLLVEDDVSGFTVRRYISDRTVIEDTESSIELRDRGWKLHNLPERLSYSATPPDFGSLAVQRQRWANGGLIILPQLLRAWRRRDEDGRRRIRFTEVFLRVNYLASISWASLGLLVLLFYPFDNTLLSRLAVLTALPYFAAMANDLRRSGYKRTDIFRVYAFNLLLLPVNLVGTIQSIGQGIGGHKIDFVRTPKVKNRTVVALPYLLLPLLLVWWSVRTLAIDIEEQNLVHGAFATANLAGAAYAFVAFVGIRHALVDVAVSLRDYVYRPVAPAAPVEEIPHWASVLYVGGSIPEEVERNAPLAVALAAHDGDSANSIAVEGDGLRRWIEQTDVELPVDLTEPTTAGDRR